jgi:glycosyltransferase involved in cell wall biosynthesis
MRVVSFITEGCATAAQPPGPSAPHRKPRPLARANQTSYPSWIRSFLNPSLSEDDLDEGRRSPEAKQLDRPVRLLFVGRVETEKGAERALTIGARLESSGIEVKLDIVGDGPERDRIEARAAALGLADRARFWGWLSRVEIDRLYGRAHFDAFVAVVRRYVEEPSRWMTESARAVSAATRFSFREYLNNVDRLVADLGAA